MLNGGDYINSSATAVDQNISDEDSLLYKMFNEVEILNVVNTNNYETKLYSFNPGVTRHIISNVVGSGIAQYTTSVINDVGGTYANQVGTGLIEMTSDKLFLLDYYDINNASYGFGDKDGSGSLISYANKVSSAWNNDSDYWPALSDNRSLYVNYLDEPNYYLRSAGAYPSSGITSTVILAVWNGGGVDDPYANQSANIRPAFNFDPANVIYSTASNVMSNGATFVAVNTVNGTKPAYKVYLKTADYVNYNDNISSAPDITLSGNSVSITKTGQSGKAIILLADKSGNGEVKYQATAEFNGGVATATLPSGVDASGYSITVLFADEVRGDNYAESISASYTASVFKSPSDVSLTYTGNKFSIDDLSDSQKSWYNDQYIDITYPDGMTDVGTHTVKAEIKSAYQTGEVKFSGTPNTDKGETQYIRYFDFKIETRYVDFPTFDNGEYKLKRNYAGDEDITYSLNSFDKNYIEVSYTGGAEGASYNSSFAVAIAKYVGVYELDVKIKDAYGDNCKLRGAPTSGKLEFEVTPAPIEIGILDGTSSNIIGIRNSKKKVTVEMPDPQKKVHMGKKADRKSVV